VSALLLLVLGFAPDREDAAIGLLAFFLLGTAWALRRVSGRGTLVAAIAPIAAIAATRWIPGESSAVRWLAGAAVVAVAAASWQGSGQAATPRWLIGISAAALLAAFFHAALPPESPTIPFSPPLACGQAALGFGWLLLAAGAALEDHRLQVCGSLAAAAVYLHGLPLAALAFVELSILFPPPNGAEPRRTEAARSVAVAISLLAVFNGGYGFSRIDLSLMSLGASASSAMFVPIAGVIVASAYAWTLLVARRFALAGGRRLSRGAIAYGFLVLAGTDLIRLALARPDSVSAARSEERLVFDLAFALLSCVVELPLFSARPAPNRAPTPAAVES